MTDTPTSKWSGAAIVVLSAFTAFMTAYKTFNDADATQDAKIRDLAVVICLETPARVARCKSLGLLQ